MAGHSPLEPAYSEWWWVVCNGQMWNPNDLFLLKVMLQLKPKLIKKNLMVKQEVRLDSRSGHMICYINLSSL